MKSLLPNICGSDLREQIERDELIKVGVEVKEKERGIFKTYGKLGNFLFHRGPTYWLVIGDVPLGIAEDIYNNKEFRPYIMVVGLSENARPTDIRKRSADYVWAQKRFLNNKSFQWVIPFYGISSIDALSFFISVLRSNSLV